MNDATTSNIDDPASKSASFEKESFSSALKTELDSFLRKYCNDPLTDRSIPKADLDTIRKVRDMNIDDMKSELDVIRAAHTILDRVAQDQQNAQEKEMENLRRQRDEATRNHSQSEKQAAAFRDIILKNSGTGAEQLDDAAIIAKFTDLRDRIQKIVAKDCQPDRLNDAQGHEGLQHFQRQGLTDPELKNRLQGGIFVQVCNLFFLKPVFGLEGVSQDNKIEEGLGQFEALLARDGTGALTYCAFQRVTMMLILANSSTTPRVESTYSQVCEIDKSTKRTR